MSKKLGTILLIDDDDATNYLHLYYINKLNFFQKVLVAKNGEEAIDLIHSLEQEPNLILFDINMPLMNGWEFIEEFECCELNEKLQSKLVVLSASLNPDDRKKAEEHPCIEDFIVKPLNSQKLEEIVRKCFPEHL